MSKKSDMMAEYLIPRLEASGQKFEPKSNNLDGIGVVNFLGYENQRIFLIDRPFTEREYKNLVRIASGIMPYRGKLNEYEHQSVFFKDGKTYFRSAAFGEKSGVKGVWYKRDKSLSKLTDDEMRRLMILKPAEIEEWFRNKKISYFQPKSERLEEALVRYSFRPAPFDYSHIDASRKFKPNNTYSKTMYINTFDEIMNGDLTMHKGVIRPYRDLQK